MSDYESEGISIANDFRNFIKALISFDLHGIVDGYLGGYWGISRCLTLSVIFFGLWSILSTQIPNLFLFAFGWVFGTAPIWLLIVGVITAWDTWIWYVRSNFISKRETILLEVKMPREITRSPRAMENALSVLWTDSGETTFFNRSLQGQCRPYFSLEIASFGGEIHFYIWCWKNWRKTVETALYAYYPEVELVEVEDYAAKFKYDPTKQDSFPTDWRYEPRNDAYPIRTYVEFELDKDPKDEYRVDPFAMVLETLSALKPTEQMWVQIIITMCRDRRRAKNGAWWETEDRFIGTIKDEIDDLRRESVGDQSKPDSPDRWKSSVRVQQYRYTEVTKAMDRNMGKHPFNVGMRGIYIADSKDFAAPSYTGLRWLWRPFGNPQYMNQLRPRRGGNPFDWPWQDYKEIRWNIMIQRALDTYRRRSHFYPPWVYPHNMMSTEVLASIWHPPSASISAPGLQRIAAKKAEPPPNLPK